MPPIVNVSLPVNATVADISLFEPFLKYSASPLRIIRKKNVFVTFTGLCMDKNGLIKESHHDYPEQTKNLKSEVTRDYLNAISNSENYIELFDNNTYLLIHHPWYNYYHWICEAILRLWMVKDKTRELSLLLPAHYRHSDFIMGSLEPFMFKAIFYIPYKKSLFIQKLCLPQIKPVVDTYYADKLKEIRNFYLNYALNIKHISTNIGNRLYISRKKASRKKVENEDDLECLLKQFDFTIINNEDYGFLEQIAIFSNASYLISIHGSGLTNMIFMKKNSHILEFRKRKTNKNDWYSNAFWYLADSLGYFYYHQLCEPTNINDNYFTANLMVDLTVLKKNLELMFA